MDFLLSFGKKLKEFEEQARLLAEAEANRAAQERKASAGTGGSGRSSGGKGKKRGRDSSDHAGNRTLTSVERFGTDPCPSDMPPPLPGGAGSNAGNRLVDDLHGRLDEAFLLSEILGPPRCIKGWDG